MLLSREADWAAFPPAVHRGACFSSRSPVVLATCFDDSGHLTGKLAGTKSVSSNFLSFSHFLSSINSDL